MRAILAAVVLGIGLGLGLAGCSSSSTTPADKMGAMDGKMNSDKKMEQKMSDTKIGGDKMKSGAMGDKMEAEKKPGQ